MKILIICSVLLLGSCATTKEESFPTNFKEAEEWFEYHHRPVEKIITFEKKID